MSAQIRVTFPLVILFPGFLFSQVSGTFIDLRGFRSAEEKIKAAAHVVPSERQIRWQKREYCAFIHFGMNTFTDREWGDGTEDPALFNPVDFDPHQWVRIIKNAGMKMLILTAKHHDGFCLWPTATTRYSTRYSSWKNGEGDVVGEVAAACREAGLEFGIYCSPWDRHESSYGNSPVYNEFFRTQLKELLTKYSNISEVWFDGACGEGPNGRKQEYDWPSYYSLVRQYQPGAVIAVMGPDVRWVGTEAGFGRETEWSVIPDMVRPADSAASLSEPTEWLHSFIPRDLTGNGLSGRERIGGAQNLLWYPAETDVSIRPGWYFHESENQRVKTPRELLEIYFNSVGRNSVLLLNIPPDKTGKIHPADSTSLMQMREVLDQIFRNRCTGGIVTATDQQTVHPASYLLDQDPSTFWTTSEGADSASVIIDFGDSVRFDMAMLQEYISAGQRVERFTLLARNGKDWMPFAHGTTIGSGRIITFPVVSTKVMKLSIERSLDNPAIAEFGLFRSPPEVTIRPAAGSFTDSIAILISSDAVNSGIRYTTDGSLPGIGSPVYRGPVVIRKDAVLTAVSYRNGVREGFPATAEFVKGNCGITLSTRFSPLYSAGGILALTDGLRGSTDFRDGRWQGYEGDDCDAIIDLGTERIITSLSAGFLQNTASWIFLPEYVEYSVSSDGRTFSPAARITPGEGKDREAIVIRRIDAVIRKTSARYVRLHAKNIGICPAWHSAYGRKAWLFVDEIVVK